MTIITNNGAKRSAKSEPFSQSSNVSLQRELITELDETKGDGPLPPLAVML